MDKDGGPSERGALIYKTVLYCNSGKKGDH